MVIVLMGAAGAGKTTVGRQLSEELRWTFLDGDALHSLKNIGKMSRGIPVTDEDRRSWLQALRNSVVKWIKQGTDAVLACSLLTHAHRAAVLTQDKADVKLVYLDATRPLLRERLSAASRFSTASWRYWKSQRPRWCLTPLNLRKSSFESSEPGCTAPLTTFFTPSDLPPSSSPP